MNKFTIKEKTEHLEKIILDLLGEEAIVTDFNSHMFEDIEIESCYTSEGKVVFSDVKYEETNEVLLAHIRISFENGTMINKTFVGNLLDVELDEYDNCIELKDSINGTLNITTY